MAARDGAAERGSANNRGQLGDGTTTSTNLPVTITLPEYPALGLEMPARRVELALLFLKCQLDASS